jgi:hypothetical protein
MDTATLHRIRKAAKLLAKAASTDSEREAIALVAMADSLMREVMVAIEKAETAEARQSAPRERRRMFDRRESRIPESARPDSEHPQGAAAALARYQRSTPNEHAGRNIIDRSL